MPIMGLKSWIHLDFLNLLNTNTASYYSHILSITSYLLTLKAFMFCKFHLVLETVRERELQIFWKLNLNFVSFAALYYWSFSFFVMSAMQFPEIKTWINYIFPTRLLNDRNNRWEFSWGFPTARTWMKKTSKMSWNMKNVSQTYS